MKKGSYEVKITQDATGGFFTLLTYENRCVPGIRGRHYDTQKKAEAGAKRMLEKVGA